MFIIAMATAMTAWAQEAVTVTVAPIQYVLPPHLGNYLENPGKYFTLTLKNNTEQTQFVYMGMQIDQIMPQPDLHVITPPARMPQVPFTINPGDTKVLNPVEMRTMFNHLAMSDISVSGEVKNGLLPEGTYEARLMAYKYDPALTSPYPLSNPLSGHCTFQICYLSDAPQFMEPFMNVAEQIAASTGDITTGDLTSRGNTAATTTIRSATGGIPLPNAPTIKPSTGVTINTTGISVGGTSMPTNIDYGSDLASLSVATLKKELPLFTWTNPYNNCGLIGNNVTYTLTIKEMMPGQSPYEAMDYGAVVYEKPGLMVTQCLLPESALQRMYSNIVYVAQLKAECSSVDGAFNYMAFKNDGKSEIKLFRLGSISGPTTRIINPPGGGGSGTGTGIGTGSDDDDEDDEEYVALFGKGGSRDSLNADSLYTFRNPTITSPTFLEGVARKLFINDDMSVEWRDVWHLGGEGMKPDTLNFEYEVQIFNGHTNANLEETLKGEPFYTQRLNTNKDDIKWDKIKNFVQKGDYLVLRVKPVCLNKKASVAFVGDDLNVKDFVMTEHLYRTLLNCDDNVAVSNKQPTTKSANELKNTTVTIGQYQLTLDGDLSGNGQNGFTGTGHVEWNPLGLRAMVAVKFTNLKINTEGVVYEGIAKSYPGNDLPGIESVQEIFSEWGVDNIMADTEIPYSEVVKTVAMDQAQDIAEKYNLNTYYTYIKTYGKSLQDGDLGNLHLPISVSDAYNGSPVDIQIEEMQFRPTFATMNLIGEMELPESYGADNDILILGAPFLCISPDRFLPETGNLCLLGDFKFKDPKSGFDIKFKATNDLREPVDGCFVSWKDDKFHALQLHAEMGIPNLLKDVDGEVVEGQKPILTVRTTIDDWEHWRASGSMDAFQVEDLPGYTFRPGTVLIDHHPGENDPLMSMPKGYDKALGNINSDEEWQGLYMRDLYVSIPDFIESKSAANSKVTNTADGTEAEVKVEEGRITFQLDHLYIDLFNEKSNGLFTCKANLNTEKVLTASTNSLGGWGISLDAIYVDMLQSNFIEAGFRGKFSIPLLKDKEGNRAQIAYKAYIPSSDKAGKRMYCFETSQEVDVMMDFFLAEATFDPNQTYFFVEKPENEDTRVELCLSGEITVNSQIAESETIKKATSIGFKLPKIEFSHMRLANCPRWKSKGSDLQAAAYEKWLKDVGKDSDTEMSDNESVYFDIGKWGHASPKKKVGGLDFNLNWPSLNLSRIAKGEVGLQLGGDLMLLDGALSFGGKFTVWADIDWSDKSISYSDTSFDEFRINADHSAMAGIKITGSLIDNSSFFKAAEALVGDSGGGSGGSGNSGSSGNSGNSEGTSVSEEVSNYVSGDVEAAKAAYQAASETIKKLKGFRGDLQFTMPGGLFSFKASGAYAETAKTASEISYEQGKRWAKMEDLPENKRTNDDGTVVTSANQIKVDETYTYAFLEIAVGSKALSAIQPIGITELSGGFYMNCRKKDLGVSFSSDNVVPQYGMVGGMIGIGLSCIDEHTITADGDLTVFYDMFHKRLSTIRIKAGIHAINGDNPKNGLINANATITYEDTNEKQYFEVDVTADMTADMDDALAEFVGSDYVKSLKEFSRTSLEEMGEEEGRNTESSEEEKNEKKKEGESKGHLSAGVYINVNFKITWKDKGKTLTNSKGKNQPKWHVYVGKPMPDKERCRITFIDFALGKKSDAFAMWATIYADAYLCLGNELPIDDLPPIPEEISDYLGITNSNLNQGKEKDLNAEMETSRTKQFSTFKPDGNEGGIMFGAKVYGDMGLNAGIVYVRTTAIAGFDVMLMKLKQGTKCIGGGLAGKNGWYGMGQVYALLKGEIGLNIDMWLFSGHIPLIDVGMGALLKAGMPNPSWFYGKAKAHYRLLGGLIKGSTSVQLKAGEVCTPEFGNPLDDIEIFNEVQPGSDNQSTGWNKDNVIEATVYPSFTTNMEMETPLRLLDENKAYAMADFDEELEKYSEQASRTYRFMLSPDSIRLIRYNVDQVEADKPKSEFDEKVTYTTKDHELFKVASGTLDINKLYALKLSGYAQEWRDGEWGDPFFNDSTTGNVDKRVKWYQTQYYYFRTDPKAPDFEKDVKLFNTDYEDDIKRPTMALARLRKVYENYDDVNNPVSMRIEVSRNGSTGWESPSKIIHNMAEQQKYDAAVAKRNEAYEKAYKEAMAEYERKMEQYNKVKEAAHAEWVAAVFEPWMNEHYAGWKDWDFIVRVKEYKDKPPVVEAEIPDEPHIVLPPKYEDKIKDVIVDEAKEKAEVGKIKDIIDGQLGSVIDGVVDQGNNINDNTILPSDTQRNPGSSKLPVTDVVTTPGVNQIDDKLTIPVNNIIATGGDFNSATIYVPNKTAQVTGTNVIVNNSNINNSTNVNTSNVITNVNTNITNVNTSVNTNVNVDSRVGNSVRQTTSTLRRSPGPRADIDIYMPDTVTTRKAQATTINRVTTTKATTTPTRTATATQTTTNTATQIVKQGDLNTTGQKVLEGTVITNTTQNTAVKAGKVSTTGATSTSEKILEGAVIMHTTDQSGSDDNTVQRLPGRVAAVTGSNTGLVIKEKLNESDIQGIALAGTYTPMQSVYKIYNHYNPAYGDKSVNGPQHIVIYVDENGNQETVFHSFTKAGQPYVELQNGFVTASLDITSEQWTFLDDHDVPEFFYDDPANPMPVPPTYGDTEGLNLPTVNKPDYQRDMDSKTFRIPIDEYTYTGTQPGDFIFLRTKNDVDISFLEQVKKLGYNWMRISVNRVHKKAFDDLLNHTDSVIAEYIGHQAEKLDEVMGDSERQGYDSKASMGKGYNENNFLAADGSMNMDAYLNSYIGELENDTKVDSILLQKIRSNIDLKDFSECLYSKVFVMPKYKDFKAHYTAESGDVQGPYVRHHLMEITWSKTPSSTDKAIVENKEWMGDPYLALGYWSKWAMIGGVPPLGVEDFPGLQLEMDKSNYRTSNHHKYTTGGHLLPSGNGSELVKFRKFFSPAMFYNDNRDDNHRYGDSGNNFTTQNFLTRTDAQQFFTGLIYADCRLAAAIRNAAYDIAALARISENNRIYSTEEVYNKIEKNHAYTAVNIDDYFSYKYTNRSSRTLIFNNKATFVCLNVPLMIYGDYNLWNRTGPIYDNAIKQGSIYGHHDYGVIYNHPEISWRLERNIAHQVCVDNCLQDGTFTRTTAASLAARIKSLKLQSYRLNAFHTKQTSEDYIYDVCLQKNAGNQYELKVDLETFDAPFSADNAKDFDFTIPIK